MKKKRFHHHINPMKIKHKSCWYHRNLKSFVVALVACLTVCTVLGEEPFTRNATGRDWKNASLEYRHSFCDMEASGGLRKMKPTITGDWLLEGLNTFYDTTDPNILNQKINEIIALLVTASG